MGYRLLVVDDSRVSRMLIKGKMASLHPEWEIFEAVSGDEALSVAPSIHPDFVTMDVNMPGINGFEAAERLCAMLAGVRVALLTANIQESSRERAAQLGVKFVKKPITEAAIQEAIDYFLGTA